MNAEHKRIIKENRSILQKNICFEKLIEHLKECKMFNRYMWADLNSMSDLLDLLPTRGPKAFNNFLEILRKANYKEEADFLEKSILTFEDRLGQYYKMSSFPLGYCLIVNNVEFDSLMYRKGSDVDANSLRDFFKRIGYDVNVERNMKTNAMENCIEEFSRMDFSKVDSMVLIVMSHGDEVNGEEFICGTDGNYLFKSKIYEFFHNGRNESLDNKPKMFIFIACRGDNRDYGVSKESTDGPKYVLSDIFIVHSTLPDQVSILHSDNGSYFCQALISVLNKYHTVHDLETIIKLVNKRLEGVIAEEHRTVLAAHTEHKLLKKKIMLYRRS